MKGSLTHLLKMPGLGVYSPWSRRVLMVCRINAGERRILLSVSMSARDGGMKVAFSWFSDVVASPWESFFSTGRSPGR
nr:hypothetical protein GCM10020185_62090 [Pseudomonas brassicacearum subsp. brassicacearum]